MEIKGTIKTITETQTFGSNGFRKREVVITTNEQYPQHILIEFIQDRCDLLNNYRVGQEVKITINLKGREWINPEGIVKYFNSIQGWKIELVTTDFELPSNNSISQPSNSFIDDKDDGLPF